MLVVSLKNSNLEKEEKERIINLVKTSNQLEIFEYDIEEEKYLEVSIEKGGFYTSFLIVRDKMNKNYIFDIHESTIKAKNIIDIKMSELMTDKYHYITYLDKKGFVLTESIQRFEEYELFKHITTHQKDELKEKNAIVEDIVDFEQISEKQYQILKEQQKQNS